MTNDIPFESYGTATEPEVPTETASPKRGYARVPKATLNEDAAIALGYLREGATNSFAIQKIRPEWNANYVRRIFTTLEADGLVIRTGQKRGTKYSVAPLDTPVD